MKQMVGKIGNKSVLVWVASGYILNEILGFLNTMCVKFLECNLPTEKKASVIFIGMSILVLLCSKRKEKKS
ncbi:hypothetical protein ANS017_13210 [Paraclostridium bifermentans]|uniref:hypothetical protein n=1 Tax=Paraclostridium bifermentans TaxID=1490 RepID=UPI0021C2A7BE|nr:hypothetical protein [Paraclostridium bifermentans]GKZ02635.1 hypothetical protein ANS014_10690 [Paraclostridium bifermentans]GKZ07404.1 hypothetical protein ANS015_22870 [Paraclostridium bifermentans]GKZ09937.1 hypothetical protein ANS017_13210 [Paraclostridium bifermentans]